MLAPVAHVSEPDTRPNLNLPLRGDTRSAPSSLSPLGIPMSFARNMEIFAEGEPAGNVYKVVSGVVRVSKLLPDGRRQISAFHTPGDMFGFEVDDVHHASAEAVGPEHPFYGGWGYGNRGRPDVSNTHFALEALHEAGVPESDPAFKRAIAFLQRMQMIETTPDGTKVNDQAYAKGSKQGGFIYATAVNKDSVGQGQSFAGEIVESQSGPPGCEAVFTLDKSVKSGMTREDASKRLEAAAKNEAGLAGGFMVVMGATGDGKSSREITVRAPMTDAEKLRAAIGGAFADVLGEKPSLAVRRIEAWQGVSRLRAYGTVSYAGFKSYLYASLSRNDPRVLAVKDWVSRNYTLEENPGMGTDGLYYYFNVFAPALEASGEEMLRVIAADGSASQRNWRADLVARLATLQDADGSFRSVDDRWLEDNKVLITAYALRALQHAAR